MFRQLYYDTKSKILKWIKHCITPQLKGIFMLLLKCIKNNGKGNCCNDFNISKLISVTLFL